MDWPGRFCRTRPRGPAFVNAIGRRSALAPAASSPRRAAASAGNSPANSPANSAAATAASAANGNAAPAANANAASAASAASAAATAASAAAAAASFVYQAPKRSRVLLVEDVERRQADVGDFLFTEDDFVTRCHVRCQRSVHCRHGRCRCAPHERKSQPDGPQSRYRFRHTLSLRSLLHSRHCRASIPADIRFEYGETLSFANLPCKVGTCVGAGFHVHERSVKQFIN
jgi:hypothetical protein